MEWRTMNPVESAPPEILSGRLAFSTNRRYDEGSDRVCSFFFQVFKRFRYKAHESHDIRGEVLGSSMHGQSIATNYCCSSIAIAFNEFLQVKNIQSVNVRDVAYHIQGHHYESIYRVFFKKVLHKREKKMQEKMMMTQQEEKNLVQVQQHCSVYFCLK